MNQHEFMNQNKVTALVPLKNYHPVFLKKALGSVIDQSCPDWELLIIVEKRNSDHFRKLLEQELADSRVGMILNEGRKLAGALNTGMRHATTDFVAILLADDMWSSDAVHTLNTYIDAFRDVDFFHSSRRYIDEHGRPISSVYMSRQSFGLEDFKLSSPVKHLLCWRKDKALSFGGMDESLNSVGPDDYDFPWCMAESGANFMAIKECLYIYRDHRDCYRLTTHLPLSLHKREIRRIMKKHRINESAIKLKISAAKSTYLRQCLYGSALDKWIKEILGDNLGRAWRQKYD
jgi:glycosyltransferase involved in cell wall biosynthesis